MKKTLFTLVFSLLIIFIGASLVKAETPSPVRNSVKLSESSRVSGIRLKIQAIMNAPCTAVSQDCAQLLADLVRTNNEWERSCNRDNPSGACWLIEVALIDAGDAYNTANCTIDLHARNIRSVSIAKRKDNNG